MPGHSAGVLPSRAGSYSRLGKSRQHGAARGRLLRSPAQCRREVKNAANAEFAFHPDTPFHQIYQTGANRESQSRSPEPARDGFVRLTEGFEDRLNFVTRNSHPGITDREVKR